MNTYQGKQKNHNGAGLQVLKWAVFGVELLLLCLLLLITFMVPVVPGFPRGKVPDEALFVLLSGITSLMAGWLFLKGSNRFPLSFVGLLSTPPCIIGLTVITIVVVPISIGFFLGK